MFPVAPGARCPGGEMSTSSAAEPRVAAEREEARVEECTDALDDSLTSLQWLQDFSIVGASVPPPHPQQQHMHTGADAPASPLAGDPASIGMPLTPGKPTAAAYCAPARTPDYRSDPRVKPPFSYATLICMAMQASKKSKITLSCIYKWITDNFCYYRHADPTWQNSIRHNLSLNKCFIKVPRQKDEPGKGGFWKIDPQYAERLLSGSCRKRRPPPVQINPALQTRFRPPPGAPLTVQLQQLGEEQRWDPRPAEGTMLGSWPVVKGRGGVKRKQPPSCRRGGAKVIRRSSSPLLCGEEQKDGGPLKGHFDWDALLDSALSGELSLDGGSLDSGGPLSPILKDEEAAARHAESDFDEETFLATAFLETRWPGEEEELQREEEERVHVDFLCGSAVSLDQLFDLGDSLGAGDGLL